MSVNDERVGQIGEVQVSDPEDDQQGVGVVFRQAERARRWLPGPRSLGVEHCAPDGAGEAHDFG